MTKLKELIGLDYRWSRIDSRDNMKEKIWEFATLTPEDIEEDYDGEKIGEEFDEGWYFSDYDIFVVKK